MYKIPQRRHSWRGKILSKEIVAFGEIAVSTKDGALFVAKKDSVEGRAKITLVPIEETDYYERLENPESFEAEPEHNYEMEAEVADISRDVEEEARQELDAEAEMESLAEAHANDDSLAEHEIVDVDAEQDAIEEDIEYRMKMESS